MRIDSSGNFGIGVTPNVKLQVKLDTNKHLYFQGNIGEIGNVPGIQGVTDAGALAGLGLRGSDLRFATGSSERVRIDSAGNVGINNTSPGSYASDGRNLVVGSGSGTNALRLQVANQILEIFILQTAPQAVRCIQEPLLTITQVIIWGSGLMRKSGCV